ncbi:PA2817 family protein [Motiliproteus sp.]|uniref:PA2817 family protein n=1 Tax=Motiliproteus sp. TaxID=1898955 RepID=UPI003BAD6B6B
MSQAPTIHTQLQQLFQQSVQALEATGSEEAVEIIEQRFEQIFQAIDQDQEYRHLAQDTISSLITMHPNLTPLIPRLLLWQLGGTCLHFLSDEEIEQFSQQDELH